MKANALRSVLSSYGWTIDRWGHAQKLIKRRDGVLRQYRVKIQPRTVRFEGKTDDNQWVRLDGCFYGHIELNSDGVKIGRYTIKPKAEQ